MQQVLFLQQLTDKLVRLEEEMGTIRQELAGLRRQAQAMSRAELAESGIAYAWADKQDQRCQMQDLFVRLSIHGKPAGVQLLQQQMGQMNLSPDELSHDITEAREE